MPATTWQARFTREKRETALENGEKNGASSQ
jgi:hypothetical protein